VNDILIEHANATRRNRTHRQFPMTGGSELPDEKYVHWNAKRRSDLVGDRDAASRQRKDDDVVAASVLREARRQDAASSTTIDE
jgi:hypothetical protein